MHFGGTHWYIMWGAKKVTLMKFEHRQRLKTNLGHAESSKANGN